MGKASRWLKSLLGMKRGDKQSESGALPPPNQTNKKDRRRRWSFTHSTHNTSVPPPRRVSLNIPTASWPRTNRISEEDDSDKHAVKVAAATAAAAEAAVAASQAAMAVVRLTSRGSSVGRHLSAAVKIQTVFRGYLARKALKALKALVKLQAHVRGFLVRKRATATLHGMQALIRAQSTARAAHLCSAKSLLETQPTLFEERLYETRSEIHSSRRVLSDPYYDDTAKIVEIDTYYTKPRTRRPNNTYAYASEYGDHDMRAFPIPRPTAASFSTPTKLSVPSHRYEWGPYEIHDDAHFCFHRKASSTAHSTPRLANGSNGPFTPVKSVCDEGPFRQLPQPAQPHRLSGSYHPNYMASTQSFEAKSRSQSAPKQRPTTQPSPSKKRMPLEKVMECRRSLSGVKMNRSYSGEAEEGPHYRG